LEGKAKLPARVPCTALFVFILIFSFADVSAQDESSVQTPDPVITQDSIQTPEPETPDPNRAAQQSLTFPGASVETIPASQGVSIFSIFRVLLTLAVVAAAIYGLVYFLKFRRTSQTRAEQDPFLKILASAPLAANRGVHVISVGPQAWLVGSAETGVNLISEIGDKDTINAMLLEDSRRIAAPEGAAGPLLDFKAILGKLGISANPEGSGPNQIRKRSERLKGL
jgi:flagellar protein FliO/FliZ